MDANTLAKRVSHTFKSNNIYSRRNNVEISGLPEMLTNLQSSIIKIGSAVGIKIKPIDIQACHRLPKGKNHRGQMKVIARFVNRKTSETLIRSN